MNLINPYMIAPTGGCANILNTTTTYLSGTGTTLHYVPYSAFYNYSLGVWLMTASELGGAKQFTGLQLNKAYNETLGITQTDQTIKMYHTTATILPSTIQTSGTFGSSLTLTGANALLPVNDETTCFDGDWFQTANAGWKNMDFNTNNFLHK